MGKTLYLECESGISGDMTVAALLDLGASEERLRAVLATLPLEGFDVKVSTVWKSGVKAADFDVLLSDELNNHDHDMEWLHGHGNGHEASPHHHAHEHRTLADVLHVLGHADASPRAKCLAERIFTILAQAEANAHGTTVDKVHFHEVGAVDSIVDVVSVAVCLDDLDIDDVYVSELAEGTGTIRCAHGILPVPVPAVASIVCDYGLPVRTTSVRGELVTPTGAAIAAAVKTLDKLPDRYVVKAVGVGAGKRTYEGASGFLRAMVIEPFENLAAEEHVAVLECDVDDCTGEALGLAMDKLLGLGAREVHYLPIYTKKNRPAWQIQVVCMESDRPALEAALFEETTTIGVRRHTMERTVLPRSIVEVNTPFGPVQAKEVVLPSGSRRRYPEHDDVARLAAENGIPYQEAFRAALSG